MRILMQWLSEGGHECRVLSATCFEGKPPDDLSAHLGALGVPLQRQAAAKTFVRSVQKPANMVVGRATVELTLKGVPVTMLLTRAAFGSPAEQYEMLQ